MHDTSSGFECLMKRKKIKKSLHQRPRPLLDMFDYFDCFAKRAKVFIIAQISIAKKQRNKEREREEKSF